MDAFRNTQRPFVAPKPPKTPKTVKPKAPRLTRPKLPDPNKVASDQAMSAFRQALAQLQQVTPQVDANAIRAPYQAASVATGQLGGGLQAALLQSGQAAQSQYTAGLGQAQQQAAQFGISAGAGANPTALVNNGSQLIAQQTQAQAAAAPQAATAWQQLLERTAAAKVSDAQLGRSNLISSAQAQLAGNIPSMIADEKNRAFQAKTQRENMGLAYSQLSAKDRQYAQQYGLDALKLRQQGAHDQTQADIDAAKLRQKTANDAAKLRVSQDTLALKRRTQKATASGLKGVAAAAKALSGTTSKAGTKLVPKGWLVTVGVLDPDTGEPTGDTQELRLPRKDRLPKGPDGKPLYKFISAKTNYEKIPTSAGSAGITRSTWDAQMRALLAQNPGRAAEVKAFLGPRPKK